MSLKSTGAEGNRQFIEKENMAVCCAMRKKKKKKIVRFMAIFLFNLLKSFST